MYVSLPLYHTNGGVLGMHASPFPSKAEIHCNYFLKAFLYGIGVVLSSYRESFLLPVAWANVRTPELLSSFTSVRLCQEGYLHD